MSDECHRSVQYFFPLLQILLELFRLFSEFILTSPGYLRSSIDSHIRSLYIPDFLWPLLSLWTFFRLYSSYEINLVNLTLNEL